MKNCRLMVCFTEYGGAREDCSVFYSEYVLVVAPATKQNPFSEPIFDPDNTPVFKSSNQLVEHLVGLGYEAELAETLYVDVTNQDDD